MTRQGGTAAQARWWHIENGLVRCDLCPHGCLLGPGVTGLCGVRQASSNGRVLLSLNAGFAASIHIDPVEKKPLYHWHPGTQILSIGTIGCNLRCPFCQNWELARWDPSVELQPITPRGLLETAERAGSRAVAFTYNEPTVWFEFLSEAAPLLKKDGYDVVLVTNGTINPGPLKEILPFVSAANVDLKAFSEEGYKKLGGFLEPVLETIRVLKDAGVHVELTHLLVPGFNIDTVAFEAMINWICEVDAGIPLHLSRYFPRWKWVEPATELSLMEEFRGIASRKLPFVYMGNVPFSGTTRCRRCGRDIVVREGYNIVHNELDSYGKCRSCGQENGFIVGG